MRRGRVAQNDFRPVFQKRKKRKKGFIPASRRTTLTGFTLHQGPALHASSVVDKCIKQTRV